MSFTQFLVSLSGSAPLIAVVIIGDSHLRGIQTHEFAFKDAKTVMSKNPSVFNGYASTTSMHSSDSLKGVLKVNEKLVEARKIFTNKLTNILKVVPSNEVQGRLAARLSQQDEEEQERLNKGSMAVGALENTAFHASQPEIRVNGD